MKGTTAAAILTLATLASPSLSAPLDASSSNDLSKRATDTTTIDLSSCAGSPQHFGQGVLYGMSGTNTPPQSYVQDLQINYESAGGAQTDAQPAGYSSSLNSYKYRFGTVLNAWRRIRAVNGVMIVKLADLWGADETQSSSFVYPGDNGDWTAWTNFCNQVISDLKANGMTASYQLQLELWNEPDINFGGRNQAQFNEAFVRGVKIFRAAFPGGSGNFLPLVGPSTASWPGDGNGWWQSFASYLRSNGGTGVQPDVWNWHMEGGGNNDPIPPAQYLPGFLSSYGLNGGIGYQNNEYSTRPQQVPSWQAWFKARYERLKFNGLRGNWASGAALNDLLAQLLIKNNDGSYSTTGDYQGWKYYALMGNSPCSTTSGNSVDSYATAGTNNATALIGSQGYTGTVNAVFKNVNSRFGSRTSLQATLINIPYNNGGVVNGWKVNRTFTVPVSGNSATVAYTPSNANDAWAVRLT